MELIKIIEEVFGTLDNPKEEIPTPIKIGELEENHLNALRLNPQTLGAYCVFNAYRGAKQGGEIKKIMQAGAGAFEDNFHYSIQRAAFLEANSFISKKELHEMDLPKGWNPDYFHEFAYILKPRKVPKP